MATLGVVGALVVLASAWFGTGTVPALPVVVSAFPAPSSEGEPEPLVVVVYVSGAVQHPGLVTVGGEPRVADAISAAGGAIRSADLSRLNLAAPVRDGEHIHVPAAQERANPAMPVQGDGVDLNSADAATLEQLPGVGPVLAARIVAYRDEHGPFGTIEDLLDVAGIGEAKLAMLRDVVRAP